MTDAGGFFARLDPRKVVWICAAAAFIAFLPSVLDGFVFDDAQLIVKNPFAHDLHHLGRCFTTDLWDTPERPSAEGSTRFYRPLVCASYVLNWHFGGGNAWTFHLVNVLLHVAASALAARVALRWTGSPASALFAGLLFAVHPSRTENVEWISGRTDVLMAVFLLGAHELAVHAARRGKASSAVGAAFGFLCAIFCKEFAVCWPLFLGVEAVIARENTDAREKKRLVAGALLALFAAVLYVGVRARVYPIRPTELDDAILPPALHVAYVFLSLGYYVERLVFPWPQTFHFRPVAISNGAPVLHVPSIAVGVIAASVFLFWGAHAGRRDRTLGALVVVTLLAFLPILNVSYTGFPGTTADRFLYLPLLPLAAAICRQGSPKITRWTNGSRLAPLVTVSLALVFAGIDWVRSVDYVSNESIWRHELEVNPDNPQALAGLAEVFATTDDPNESIALLRRALSPEAQRFGLLASPTRAYVALLELLPRDVADGDVATLSALFDEVRATADGRPRGLRLPNLGVSSPAWDPHLAVQVENAAPHLDATAAVLASRLGRDADVRLFATRIADGAPLDGPTRYNLALALVRAADFEAARRELAIAVDADSSDAFRAAAAEFSELAARLERQERETPPGSPARLLRRARSYFELGAYLRAARVLRRLYASDPANAEIWPAYAEALSWARLDADAEDVAAHGIGPDRAAAYVASLREKLSPHTARLPSVPAGTPWWTDAD